MSFEDERIAAMRRAEMKKQYGSVETGMYVGEVRYTFSERVLFGGTFCIMLPDSLSEMDGEEAVRKYPSAFRAGVILADGSGLNLGIWACMEDGSEAILFQGPAARPYCGAVPGERLELLKASGVGTGRGGHGRLHEPLSLLVFRMAGPQPRSAAGGGRGEQAL